MSIKRRVWMKVKICGLKQLEDVRVVNKYHPDYVGFVFAGVKRRIDVKTAMMFKELLDPCIQAVGVFVNEPIETIRFLVSNHVIDLVQLHGDETDAMIQTIQSLGVPVIKAIRVQSKKDLETINYPSANYLLYDRYEKDAYGGTGKPLDEEMIKYLSGDFFVAGGITIHNVEALLSTCNPYAVDLSSGVETDGSKDEEKIRVFIEYIRRRGEKQ